MAKTAIASYAERVFQPSAESKFLSLSFLRMLFFNNTTSLTSEPHCLVRVAFSLFLLAFIIQLSGCSDDETEDEVVVDLVNANISGTISFENPNSAVSDYLSNHGLISIGASSVGLINQSVNATAWGPYSVTSVSTATFAMQVPVDVAAPNTSLQVVVERASLSPSGVPVALSSFPLPDVITGPSYRFGSRITGATAEQLCNVPQGSPPSTQCNVSECAARANVNVRFENSDIDLSTVLDGGIAVVCGVRALVEEFSGSGSFVPQSASELVNLPLADVIGTGGVVSLLVRADGTRVRLELTCAAKTLEVGFPAPPSLPSDWTSASVIIDELITSPPACNDIPEIDIDVGVPVEQTAGELKGLFDVNGYDELLAEITIDGLLGYTIAAPSAAAAGSPSPTDADDPNWYWNYSGVPAGSYSLFGEAVLDLGRATLRTPDTGANLGSILVSTAEVTNIEATFIADPYIVSGTVVIEDALERDLDMRSLVSNPFQSMNLGEALLTSHIEANGISFAAGEQALGTGGRARSLLQGSFNATGVGRERVARLDYTLPLTGLSYLLPSQAVPGQPYDPILSHGDGLDGSSALDTNWELDYINLRINPGSLGPPDERVRLELRNIGWGETATAGGSHDRGETRMCFGHANVDFKVNPELGTLAVVSSSLFSPGGVTGTTEISPTVYTSATANVSSLGSERWHAVLPEGIQFQATSAIAIYPPLGGSASSVLVSHLIPVSGPVVCGKESNDCFVIDGNTIATANAIPLTINTITPAPVCNDGDAVILTVGVDSGGLEVTKIELDYDALSTPIELCNGSCGTDPTWVSPAPGISIPAGINEFTIWVENEAECRISKIVTVQQSDVQLMCPLRSASPGGITLPKNHEVFIDPGETSIAASDPRVSDYLAQFFVSGGCPPAVLSGIPSMFALGENNFTVTADDQTCDRAVTLLLPTLAYIEGQQVRLHEIGGNILNTMSFTTPTVIDFSHNGRLLAVGEFVEGTSVTIVDPETGAIEQSYEGMPVVDLSVRPHNELTVAIVERMPSPGPAYRVRVLNENGELGAVFVKHKPGIGWLEDGSRLLVASISKLYTDGLEGATLRYTEGVVQADGIIEFIEVQPENSIGPISSKEMIDAAYRGSPGNRQMLAASAKGIYTRSPNGFLHMTFPNDLHDIDFQDRAEPLAVVMTGSGALDLEFGYDVTDIQVGQYAVSVEDYTLRLPNIAVAKENEIEIFNLIVPDLNLPQADIRYLLSMPASNAKSVVFRPNL